MSIVTSRDFRRWAMQSEGAEVMVLLIEIYDEALTQPILVSSDPTEFIMLHDETKEPLYGMRHQGKIYYAIPFAFVLPDQPDGNDTPKASLRVDNVSREYTETIRQRMVTAVSCTIKMVFASSPDEVQHAVGTFLLTDVQYTTTTIEGQLTANDFRNEPCPSLNFLPSSNPGMF